MPLTALPQKIFQVFIILMLALAPLNTYAENPFTSITDKIKEEIKRGKAQFKEELQRAIDQADKNANNEYKSVVPFLMGKTPQEAEYILPQYHLVLGKVVDKESDKPVGTIISQSHQPDSEIKQQTAISVEVAIARTQPKSPQDNRVTIPNLHGMQLNDAKEKIKKLLLNVGNIQEKESDLALGIVIGQQPASGVKAQAKTKLILIVAKPKASQGKYKIRLELDKEKVTVGETVVMRATIGSMPKESLEYSFTINGKVYSSSGNSLSHQFSTTGKVIVTANARKKRGKWLHSKSRWLLIEKQSETNNPTKTMTETPDVIGLSLDEAEALLKESKLTLGDILQEKSLGKSRILKQQPEAGISVAENSKVELTQSVEYDFSFMLSASKDQIQQHESVDFQGLMQPENNGEDISYRLLVDEQVLDSSTPNWTFTFDKSGSYRITAEAKIADMGTYRSSAITVQVSSVWDEPRAVIEPSSLIVVKGDKATFTSRSTHDENSDLSLFWMDEKGGSSKKRRYSINTKDWDEGDYWLSLRVKDEQGFEHTSKAELIVTNKLEPRENGVRIVELPQVAVADVQLSLSASSYHVVAEKPIQFTITQHPVTQSKYRIVFGDGKEKSSDQPWVEHIYSQFGQHDAFVETRYQQTLIQSKKITVWVWPSWVLLVAIGVGLLLLTSLFKFFKPKENKHISKKTNHLRYMPIIDEGEQTLEMEQDFQNKKQQLSFDAEIDDGKQWISYGKQTKDK